MTAKEFLRQYKDCDNRIKSKQRRIARLKEQTTSVEITFAERVQSSGGGDKMAKVVETYVDLQSELAADIIKYRAIQQQVEAAINGLEDSDQINVLERLYLEDMTLEEAAEDLNISRQWVCVLHGKALQKIFARLYNSLHQLLVIDIPPVV